MNQLKRVTLITSMFFVALLFRVTTLKAADIGICIDEIKEQKVYYEYVSTGGDFVINDQSVVSVESPEIARVVKKGSSAITWVGEIKVYENTLSITGLSEGTTKVYLDKPYIGLTLHIEVATITVTQHQWESEYRIDIEPTCVLAGQKAIYCKKCSKKQDSSEITIPAKGHTSVIDEAVVPTCIKDGMTEGSHCSECEEVIKPQEIIKAYGHKFTNYVLDNNATCTKEGTKTAVCDNGCSTKDTVVIEGSKKEHTWNAGVVTKEATCIEKEEKTYTCIMEECGATKIEEIEINPTNHKNTEIRNRKESTYIEKGYSGDTYCKDCGIKIKTGKQIPTLEKKSQQIKVATSKKISAKKVKKESQSFKLSAKSTSGSKVKYKLVKKNKYIKFAASSGKITVKKGTKKGTYKIKVKMTVSENNEYKSYSTTKTITIKVK